MTLLRLTGERPSASERGVRNSQPEGIGRVAALGNLWAWNNLGRNVVFAGPDLVVQAVFEETDFPGQDEPSQYDLDLHAIVRLEAEGLVLALNHLGALRVFRVGDLASARGGRARPVAKLAYAEDVERAVVAQGRLFTSRPARSAGLLVSEPVAEALGHERLACEPLLSQWGPVTALAASPGGDALAVGAGRRLGLFALRGGRPAPLWDRAVPLHAAWLAWSGETIFAAGGDPPPQDIGDEDWDALRGGALLALRTSDGDEIFSRRLPDLAWGNGGVALCSVPGAVCGLDRRGALHAFSTRDGAALGATGPLSDRPLGIAHAAAVGNVVIAGFNRAGYRLYAFGS
jgi:hypothetical protein